jgi:hypothetical protein
MLYSISANSLITTTTDHVARPTVVMTVFVHKALWLVLHRNASLLLAIHWTLVYRVRVSIGTTAMNGRMERIVIDLVVRKSCNLLRCDTLEA